MLLRRRAVIEPTIGSCQEASGTAHSPPELFDLGEGVRTTHRSRSVEGGRRAERLAPRPFALSPLYAPPRCGCATTLGPSSIRMSESQSSTTTTRRAVDRRTSTIRPGPDRIGTHDAQPLRLVPRTRTLHRLTVAVVSALTHSVMSSAVMSSTGLPNSSSA